MKNNKKQNKSQNEFDEARKIINKRTKNKYYRIKEMHIKKITQENVDCFKKKLATALGHENLKFVGIKFQFLTKNGILVEEALKANGFDETEWEQ